MTVWGDQGRKRKIE